MARDFNGSTDRIDYSSIQSASGQAMSLSCMIDLDTITHSFYLLLISSATATRDVIMWVYFADPVYRITMSANTDDTQVGRSSNDDLLSTGSPINLIYTWDGSLTAANMHMYIDGSEVGYNTTSDGIGNFNAADGTWSIGGRPTDDNRNVDGKLAEYGWWNRVISAGERAALAKGYSPRFFPNGLKFAPDLIRDQRDPISGKTGTLDGTSVSAHPRVIYPSKIWTPHIAAAVGGTILPQITNAYMKVSA